MCDFWIDGADVVSLQLLIFLTKLNHFRFWNCEHLRNWCWIRIKWQWSFSCKIFLFFVVQNVWDSTSSMMASIEWQWLWGVFESNNDHHQFNFTLNRLSYAVSSKFGMDIFAIQIWWKVRFVARDKWLLLAFGDFFFSFHSHRRTKITLKMLWKFLQYGDWFVDTSKCCAKSTVFP